MTEFQRKDVPQLKKLRFPMEVHENSLELELTSQHKLPILSVSKIVGTFLARKMGTN